MPINRRKLIQLLSSALLWSLRYTGIAKPQLDCVRRIRCGHFQKLLCRGSSPLKLVVSHSATMNVGGQIGDAFCESFSADKTENGVWRVKVIYRTDKSGLVAVRDEVTGKEQRFQVYKRRWHDLLYGKLPPIEDVTEDEYRLA